MTVTGGTMYQNAAATLPLGDGIGPVSVPNGQEIWLRSAGPPWVAVLQANATADVPSGNVWLWDRINPPTVTDAQRLILAETATLTTQVSATAEWQVGSLKVTKRIAGPAAGSQGKVIIKVFCDDGVKRRFIIPAGATGTRSRTFRDIPAGEQCTVYETVDGHTQMLQPVVVRGNGQEVGITANETAPVKIKDIYRYLTGTLIVRKTIAVPPDVKQGEVTIRVKCNGKFLTPDFVIPAGSPQDLYQSPPYEGIRTPATCKVIETADGSSSTVSVVVNPRRQTVHIGAGDSEIKSADISDTYGLRPGELEVNKTITGPLAGKQGEVVIHTVCNGTALTPDFIIPAGTVGPVDPHVYSNIPTPATCVVTETVNGSTSTVSAGVTGSPTTVKIEAGGEGAATITDTYGATPGSLLVAKTIAGPSAGDQGPVTIHVVCDGTGLSPDFVIPEHTPAGTVSHSFDHIPADSACTVTETADGSTATVIVTVLGEGQTVTIPAGKVVPVGLTDVYDEGSSTPGEDVGPESPVVDATGSLTVIKHITGPAARHHGRIAILVACGGPVETFVFEIRAHTGPGFVTQHFNNIPAGVHCSVTEPSDGHTETVAVAAASRSHTVTIPATGSATVHLTDRFVPAAAVTRPPSPTVTG